MINLMIKTIFDNSNKIEAIVKYINKTEVKRCIETILIGASITAMAKRIKEQGTRITNLEEMMSKGE